LCCSNLGQNLGQTAGCPRRGAGHCSFGAAEDVGDLGDGQVTPVAQDQDGALAHGQPRQRPAELGQVFDLPQGLCGARVGHLDRSLARLQLGLLPGAAVGAAQDEIDQDPAGVGDRVIHRPHPAPPPRHAQQRLLGHVLGVLAVPRHQIASTQQWVRRLGHEALELTLGRRAPDPFHPRLPSSVAALTCIRPPGPVQTENAPTVFVGQRGTRAAVAAWDWSRLSGTVPARPSRCRHEAAVSG
jgi:hypothetical protein